MQLTSTITCPLCGHKSTETMPTDACQYFYDCKGCGAVLKPKQGDCCVFCSYGDVRCPPMQAGDVSGACCHSTPVISEACPKDWAGTLQGYALAWGIPTAVILVGFLASVPLRAGLWTIALAWMGIACLLNERRCGRTHCRYTGPFYLAMILPVLVLASEAAPTGVYAWPALATVILLGSKVIWWATERAWGRLQAR